MKIGPRDPQPPLDPPDEEVPDPIDVRDDWDSDYKYDYDRDA